MTPYYDDGHCVIYHGDCLDVLPRFDNANALILDPPYAMTPNSVRGRDDGAAGTSGAPVMLVSEVLRHTRRVLIPGGVAALICDWRRVPDLSYIAAREGLRLATTIAWTRSVPATGGLFRSAWDPILVLSSGSAEAVDRAAVRNVIELNYPTVRVHPYEKPVGLWAHILRRIPTGGVVIDPFMGAASGMVDALKCGHRYVGIEVEERYCEIAANRLAQGALDLGGVA